MSSGPTYSLLYTSQSAGSLSTANLDHLLAQSRQRNQILGLTGMLVHLHGSFMQVLEGAEEAVTNLFYGKIAIDHRHHTVDVVTEGIVRERQFAQWTMAFQNLDGRCQPRPEGFSEFVKNGFTTELVSDHQSFAVAIIGKFRQLALAEATAYR